MAKIFMGIFLGTFISAILYEIINRNNPELVKRIKERAARHFEVCPMEHRHIEV